VNEISLRFQLDAANACVERLEAVLGMTRATLNRNTDLMNVAAARIAELRARVEALEAALREIAESARDPWQSIASAALAPEQDK
jgi:capsule polysaccharide export protein KpsE/RkpR